MQFCIPQLLIIKQGFSLLGIQLGEPGIDSAVTIIGLLDFVLVVLQINASVPTGRSRADLRQRLALIA